MENNIFAFWVDHKVAIAGALGTITAHDFVISQRGYFHCELDSTAVAVRGIGGELWVRCRFRHGGPSRKEIDKYPAV
jgi:hypothetical protein